MKCGVCKWADFKSNISTPLAGFAICTKNKTNGLYLNKLTDCRINKFIQASDDVIKQRETVFLKLRGNKL